MGCKIISVLQEGVMRLDPCVLRRLADVRVRVLGRHGAGQDNPAASAVYPDLSCHRSSTMR
jgi:hypothetical protein